MLKYETLFALYKIIWRIELIFKTWKFILGIHKIRSARKERVMCEVYGKLILAVFSSFICAKSEQILPENIFVSLHRAMKQVKVMAFE
ncbi:MAG TPA: transposase [Bacteroidales bacterium]|nr:transposase [Victivallales bacterium]HRT84624.1 transposase [Bacteroidales bacterium]